MIRELFAASCLALAISIAPARAATDRIPELAIYVYDSFVAAGGPGPEIFPLFEKQCGCKVRALAVGDTGELVNRVELDARRKKPGAQLVVGIDQQAWERAKPYLMAWDDWKPAGLGKLRVSGGSGFLPYDFGFYAWMSDRKALARNRLKPPRRLEDLLKPEWKRDFILEDPRTSGPGLAFVLYTWKALGPERFDAFWKSLRGQWLTLAPGWSSAYGLFLKGEAPLVWSYTTSQAYHEEHGDAPGPGRRYEALLFEEGQPLQVEGAAIIRGGATAPAELALAKRFLEFLITSEAQKRIARANWMLPALKGAPLPASFARLPVPEREVQLPSADEEVGRVLKRWTIDVESGS